MFLCDWFWFVLQNAAKGQCLAWIRAAWLWRRALTLRSIKNSWTLRNLIGISDAKFSIGIYPFQIRSSSVLSVIRPVEVRWWIYLPDLQQMYNGHVTDTKRKRNGRIPYKTDVQRTFYPLDVRSKFWTWSKFSTGQNGRQRIKRTINGHATDTDGRLTDKNRRHTDMNGLKKSYPLGVRSSYPVRCDLVYHSTVEFGWRHFYISSVIFLYKRIFFEYFVSSLT